VLQRRDEDEAERIARQHIKRAREFGLEMLRASSRQAVADGVGRRPAVRLD